MREYLEIGSSPSDEDVAQTVQDDYHVQGPKECRIFRDQLRRQFGPEPEGARLAVKGFPHDFGTYYEVVCYYDNNYPESVEYAFKLEGESPANWDEKSLQLLNQ